MTVRKLALLAVLALTFAIAVECAGPPQSLDDRLASLLQRSRPAPELQMLAPLEGSFTYELRFEGLGVDPSLWTATSRNRWALGGRFLQCEATSTKGDLAIDSLRMLGFDARTGEFTQMTLDSLSPYGTPGRGGFDVATRTISLRCLTANPASGAREEFTEVLKVIDADHYVREQWITGAAGQPVKSAETRYARSR
jgi:hypothetical protein